MPFTAFHHVQNFLGYDVACFWLERYKLHFSSGVDVEQNSSRLWRNCHQIDGDKFLDFPFFCHIQMEKNCVGEKWKHSNGFLNWRCLKRVLFVSVCNRTYYGDVGKTYDLRVPKPLETRLPFLCHLTFTANGQSHGDIVQVSNLWKTFEVHYRTIVVLYTYNWTLFVIVSI